MKFWSNLSVVSGTTLLSRILGLARDILFFSTFGASLYGEAFLVAFTIPNLFRRMLGEGTLTSAFLPVFTSMGIAHSNNEKNPWDLLNQVVSRLFLFLGTLSILVAFVSWVFGEIKFFDQQKWYVANQLNGVIFFYVIFICVSAILVAGLHVQKSFWEGAVSPVLLNVLMISTLLLVSWVFQASAQICALSLAVAVVFAGFVQFILPWCRLHWKFGWRWKFDFSRSSELSEVSSLFWVGVFGAAISQINILVSRFLAFAIEDQGAVGYLYISARLVELPLGIFAIAVSTVLFPTLSQKMSEGNDAGYLKTFYRGMRIILMLTLPSAVGLFIVGQDVIKLLFEWKHFGDKNVMMASAVLQIITWTIPVYAVSTFLVKSYHSRKNMSVPLRAATISLVFNVVFSLLLMGSYGVLGLAWANFLAALAQLLFLLFKNSDLHLNIFFIKNHISLHKILLACAGMSLAVFQTKLFFEIGVSKIQLLFQLTLFILIGLTTYFLILQFLKFQISEGKPLSFIPNRK